MKFPKLTIELPEWVNDFIQESDDVFPDVEARMGLAIDLARLNIEHKTGGPFGAAVFDQSGRLIAPGLNLVTTANCSILHAEMVALALAQRVLGRFDISDGGKHRYDLVASTEPCAMCFGAVPWSGVKRLICGARDEDARAIGFDEGPKLADWKKALEIRGIAVIRDVLRADAAKILKAYAETGGSIYNPGS